MAFARDVAVAVIDEERTVLDAGDEAGAREYSVPSSR